MNLADLIPDKGTRVWLETIYRACGMDWAATLARALMEGVLVDMGGEGARTEEVERPLPTQDSHEQGRLF